MSEHAPITVVFALFPRATQLDFTAPHEVFSLLPGAEVVCGQRRGRHAEEQRALLRRAAAARRHPDLRRDLCSRRLCATDIASQDDAFRRIRRLAGSARFVDAIAGTLPACFRGAPVMGWRDARAATIRSASSRRHIVTGAGLPPASISRYPGGRDCRGGAQAISYIESLAPPFDAGRPETAHPAVLSPAARAKCRC